MLSVLLSGAVLLAAGQAEPTFYLTCSVKSGPAVKLGEIYVKPPRNQEELAEHVFQAGVLSLVLPPSETWEVNLAEGAVKPVGSNFTAAYKVTTPTHTRIEGTTPVREGHFSVLDINRVDGTMRVTSHNSEATMREWADKHGKRLPPFWTWTLTCARSEKPRL